MNMQMQRQTTGMPYLLTDKQCIQQIIRINNDRTKVVTEHRESETEDPTGVSSSSAKQYKTL